MKTNKLYDCQIPGCNTTTPMRSTIKTGEYKGLKACPFHKRLFDGSSIKKQTEKNRIKRKTEREGLPKFFETAVEELKKNPYCSNCGCKINVDYEPIRNISHLLDKATFKSVMDNPYNWIPLCSWKDNIDGKDCHYEFDNNIDNRPNMPCYSLAKNKFEKFKHKVLENGKLFRIFEEN